MKTCPYCQAKWIPIAQCNELSVTYVFIDESLNSHCDYCDISYKLEECVGCQQFFNEYYKIEDSETIIVRCKKCMILPVLFQD